ncbi:MAG: sel1 repeat family protein [Treponema sp.]|nr:sel1 repeat family protein [Treponema sp.]
MKKIIFLLAALCSSFSFADSTSRASFKNLTTEQKQIRLEFALDITDWTKRVRTMTKTPLPDYLPASEYMYMSADEAFSEYKKIADSDSGNLLAQTVTGYCLTEGAGTQKNKEAGREYLKKAADKNFAPALNSLGAYSDSEDEAFTLYEKAASQNYVTALYNLAYCYTEGKGCEKSLEKAESFYLKIRDLHLDDSDIYSVIAGFHADELEEDEEHLIPYYIEAAEHGDRQAMFELWFRVYTKYHDEDDENNGANRAKWYRKYLETSREDYSEIMRRDAEKLPYLLERAEKGELFAVKKIIEHYRGYHYSLHMDQVKKNEWIVKAAELGDCESCFYAAELYAKGSYADFDFDKAVSYYEKGCELAVTEDEKSRIKYALTPVKEVALSALKVNGFVNRYRKSVEEFAPAFGGGYSADYSSVNEKSALAFCTRHADSDEDFALGLAYYKYLNESEAAASSYLEQRGLSAAKKFFPPDDYDPNSKEYQAKRAMYLRDEKNEIEDLEDNIARNPEDGKSYYQLGQKYKRTDNLSEQKKAFALIKKASECGYAEAFYDIATYYTTGKIFETDLKKAGEAYKAGSDLGYIPCKTALGEMYEKGTYFDSEKGVFVQDLEKAIELFKDAARDRRYTLAKFNLEKYNITLEKEDDEEYWFYHNKPRKNAKPFDWASWTFGDFEFEDLPEEEPEKIPEYTEDDGYWENTEKTECSFEKYEADYFRSKIDGLKKGKNYRLVFSEEIDSEKLFDLYTYFSESEHAATLTLDLDLRSCPVPEGYLKEHSLCGRFRNIYMPDCLIYLYDKCFDVNADKIVFGSKIKNFRDPFASGKYGLLDFTLIPDEEFTGRLAYRLSQLKVNYMRQVPLRANFEILTVEEMHSLKVMKEVRQTLESNPDKRYIVDFTHSVYAKDPLTGDDIPFPKNFMACQQNLYYLVLGDVDYVDFPENMCRDCKNLRCIVMWDYGDAEEGAFKGVNKNCTFVDGRVGPEKPLKEM